MIRVEFEETQDYVKEGRSTEKEGIFVPRATSVPQKPLFRCDNQCSEKKKQLLAADVGSGE